MFIIILLIIIKTCLNDNKIRVKLNFNKKIFRDYLSILFHNPIIPQHDLVNKEVDCYCL